MRLPITDQFLWDIYNYIEKSNDVIGFAFRYPVTMSNSLPGLKNPIFKKYKREKFSKLISYLNKKGYIKIKNLKSSKSVILTKEGISKALKASFNIESKKKRKDGKWIMVIFDVPEKNRKSRNLLRSILFNLGYKMFQQSAWISPYDVYSKTEKLLALYSLDQYVKMFLIEEI